MSPTRTSELVVPLAAQLLVGFAVGVVYFKALRRTGMRLTARKGWLEPVALTASRIGVAVALFATAARIGAVALLVTLGGFLIARSVAVYRSRRTG